LWIKTTRRHANIPVKTGNDPRTIPNNDEIATWIIPIRFVEARQLVSDLSSFVSPQATIVANEAGNSIVVTDTQSNIRHLVEIIQAVDDSAEAETEIRVFHLKYASPTDVASELGSVFPEQFTSGNHAVANPVWRRWRRPGGFLADGGGGGGGTAGGLFGGRQPTAFQNERIQKATQVTRWRTRASSGHRDRAEGFDGANRGHDGRNWTCLRTATRAFMFSR
jgi:hypothetical protein